MECDQKLKSEIVNFLFRFDFCQVEDAIEEGKIVRDSDPVENFGQVLLGERLRASAYNVRPLL